MLNYCTGIGHFWPSIAFVAIHVMLYAICATIIQVAHLKYEFTTKMFLGNVFNGLANLYCHNWIRFDWKKPEKNAKKNTLLAEFSTQLFLIAENSIILIFAFYTTMLDETAYLFHQKIILKIVISAFVLHLIGVLLKALYYWKFHIWRNIIWKDFWDQIKGLFCCRNSKSYDIIDQGTNLPLNAINQISESDSIIEITENEAEKEIFKSATL